MSTRLPLRPVRMPALQQPCSRRRCLFPLRRPSPTSVVRAFSSTPQAYQKSHESVVIRYSNKVAYAAALYYDLGEAPSVAALKARTDSTNIMKDIGMLEGTVVRAPFSKLPHLLDKRLWKYLWRLIYSKFVCYITRIAYRRCIQKRGWTQFLPVDIWNRKYLRVMAMKYYTLINQGFVTGKATRYGGFCLPPLRTKIKRRIAERGPIEMQWRLKRWKSARIVSDRAGTLGLEFPDSAFRQVVVRLVSIQALDVRDKKPSQDQGDSFQSQSTWMPREARQTLKKPEKGKEKENQYFESGKEQTVVDYMVLQTRVIMGKEEQWRVWGFVEPSTLESIQEGDQFMRRNADARVAELENN